MDSTEPPELHLSEVCRSCLSKANNMINFTEKSGISTEIITMLASVGNIEIEINEFLPCYLCKTCEEKLRLSYDFQQLIQRSNEIIRECLNETEMILADEVALDETSERITEIDDCEVMSVKRGSKTLHLFSSKEVEDAISEYQKKFYVNTGCLKCGFIPSNNRALTIHMSIVHKEMKDRWCSMCNLEVDNLTAHTSTHSKIEFICKFCGKKFKSKGHLYDHLRSHSNLKPHTCYICQRGFIAYRHLEKHLRIHMHNRIFKCGICPANFALRKSLNIHLRQHKSESKNKQFNDLNIPQNFCKLCKKRVRSLEKHSEKFHFSGNVKNKQNDGVLCTNCGKKFSCFSRFRLHMRIHTGETPYKCQYCDKRMTNRNHLVIHERTHTGERPYICNVCGRSFSQTSVLNTHMRIHTGRPIQCEICLKRFCRNAQLRLHMRKHTGEKPYQCDQCEQAFKQQSHLSEHLKRHSDERPYKCSHCDKSFKQMSILKSHLMVHTGEKPFKCSQCSYACRQRYSLTQHMRQHSGDSPNPEKPHFCVLCQKGYTTMAMLMSHKELVHGNVK